MTSHDEPVLDLNVIDELRASTGDDEAFLHELVEAYVAEVADHIAGITAAAAAGDAAAIVRPAHTLKSSSATFGAMRLAALCRRIEEAGRSGGTSGLGPDPEQVSAAWTETLMALRAAGLAA
jgi:HPt (histidine-containing phosphotransfer) domain-containing protein